MPASSFAAFDGAVRFVMPAACQLQVGWLWPLPAPSGLAMASKSPTGACYGCFQPRKGSLRPPPAHRGLLRPLSALNHKGSLRPLQPRVARCSRCKPPGLTSAAASPKGARSGRLQPTLRLAKGADTPMGGSLRPLPASWGLAMARASPQGLAWRCQPHGGSLRPLPAFQGKGAVTHLRCADGRGIEQTLIITCMSYIRSADRMTCSA